MDVMLVSQLENEKETTQLEKSLRVANMLELATNLDGRAWFWKCTFSRQKELWGQSAMPRIGPDRYR